MERGRAMVKARRHQVLVGYETTDKRRHVRFWLEFDVCGLIDFSGEYS